MTCDGVLRLGSGYDGEIPEEIVATVVTTQHVRLCDFSCQPVSDTAGATCPTCLLLGVRLFIA